MRSFINIGRIPVACHRKQRFRTDNPTLKEYKNPTLKEYKNPTLKEYKNRNSELRIVGWDGYKAYLESDVWKKIREQELRRPRACEICRNEATQLHHWSYEIEVMMGTVREHLIPICKACHEKIEFTEDGTKLSLPDANRQLHRLSSRPSHLWSRISKGWKKIETANVARDLEKKKRKRKAA